MMSHLELDTTESFWNEPILYAATYVPVVVVTGIVLAALNAAISGDVEAPLVVHHLVSTSITILLLIYRRRGAIAYPDWLLASSWGLSEYLALFGSVFLITYTYVGSVTGLTPGPGALVAVICATGAVILRRAGAFV